MSWTKKKWMFEKMINKDDEIKMILKKFIDEFYNDIDEFCLKFVWSSYEIRMKFVWKSYENKKFISL